MREPLEALLRPVIPSAPAARRAELALAHAVLRFAVREAVLALAPELPEDCEPAAAAAALRDRVAGALGLPEVHAVEAARLVERDGEEVHELSDFELRQELEAAERFLDEAHSHLSAPERALSRLLVRRCLRVGGLALVLALVLGAAGGATWLARRPPDLTVGRPWRASSTYGGWDPASYQPGAPFFFHTNRDASPYIAYDLGDGARFSSVEIVNRTDCCNDRASFLVVETSQDGNKWEEVATHSGAFSSWTARFAQRSARHLRVRSLKPTWLHFARVAVR
ncbi:MAG: discoidin domain-containing protein [Polyangiaceae bacterium]|nr:discoidin domain-containing protein [Polyangiaceae bacterium]